MDETARADVIVGVDTHKHVHAAVAIDALGARLGATNVPVGERGYRALEAWARSPGPVRAFGVEGTGSYGAGLSRFLVAQGHAVLEVNRPDRQLRRRKGGGFYAKCDGGGGEVRAARPGPPGAARRPRAGCGSRGSAAACRRAGRPAAAGGRARALRARSGGGGNA